VAQTHQLQLSPNQSQQLRQARLVLINGYGLTPSVAGLPGAVPIAELAVPESPQLPGPAQPVPPTAGGHDDHDHANHDHGNHDHGNQDPHVWHDPRQASAMVRLVGERLARLAPTAAPAIRRRASTMTSQLAALDQWNSRQLATIPRDANGQAPPLASGHRAFTSLARRYGLRELAVVDGSSSSTSLRPQAFEAVVRQLQQERVPVLFAEQQPAPRNLERISTLSGVPLAAEPLLADGLAAGSNGAGNLLLTLTGNTCAIAEGLGGQCDRKGQRLLIRQWEAIR
jgi:zinc/manganese transport system substrate-binding protein